MDLLRELFGYRRPITWICVQLVFKRGGTVKDATIVKDLNFDLGVDVLFLFIHHYHRFNHQEYGKAELL